MKNKNDKGSQHPAEHIKSLTDIAYVSVCVHMCLYDYLPFAMRKST